MNRKVTLSIDSLVYKKFQGYCENHAIMLSKKIELIMRDIMNENKEGEKNEK